jgi:hypothetical protein
VYVGMNQSKSSELDRGNRVAQLSHRNDTLLETETQNVMNVQAVKANRRDAETRRALCENGQPFKLSGIAFDVEHSVSRFSFTLSVGAEIQRSHGSAVFLSASPRLCGA